MAEPPGDIVEPGPGQVVCACGSINERHYMFCAQCGTELGADSALADIPEEGEVIELVVTMEPTASALPPEQRPGAFRCPRCRHPCAAHAVFCVGCGLDLTSGTITRAPRSPEDASLPAPTPNLDAARRNPDKCPSCGEQVASHYAVCRACGAVVKPISMTGARPELDEKPRLFTLAGPYQGQIFPLPERKIILGRSEASDIELDADDVSRSHAVLVPASGKWKLTDLHSANGTTVNGKALKIPTVLEHGDTVRVGKLHEFRFLTRYDDTPPPPPEPPVKRSSRRRRRKSDPTTPLVVIMAVLVVVVAVVIAVLAMRG